MKVAEGCPLGVRLAYACAVVAVIIASTMLAAAAIALARMIPTSVDVEPRSRTSKHTCIALVVVCPDATAARSSTPANVLIPDPPPGEDALSTSKCLSATPAAIIATMIAKIAMLRTKLSATATAAMDAVTDAATVDAVMDHTKL